MNNKKLMFDFLIYLVRTPLIPPYMVKNGASAISPSTSFVFITKFGFRPIRITLNSWETKIRNLQIYIFKNHIWSYGCATFDEAAIIFLRMRCRGD